MEHNQFNIRLNSFHKNGAYVFSSGKQYQILFISKGKCQFDINGVLENGNTETAVFMKPDEKITMHYEHKKYPLEMYLIRISGDYLKDLSDENCNLLNIVTSLPFSKGFIHLDTRDTTLMKNITKTILSLSETTKKELGHDLYQRNMISILMILFLRSCAASDHYVLSRNRKNLVMDDIFRYIREHLTEDLSLEVLEKHFYVSRHHLCREFKRLTGQTIHSYIIKSRLDLCKKYIESGRPIKEVYALGGFGSYNHFFKAFKKEYDMTPKAYYDSLKK